MKKINNSRAKLLHENFSSNAASSFSEMAAIITIAPSYTETKCCSETTRRSSIVYLNSDTFNNDWKNLAQAIKDNFPDSSMCDQCNASPKFKLTFGPHLLIEVICDSLVLVIILY